ncbi:hypothetical protein SAMN06297468_1312 [Altererythrobacter xiamenensis]|uniref:Membrane protein involved in the export of O-antigen and teichoic acid n=2 Tax=Altererythrobacter xiamenensis TaxID=1316679 RepID=A0A1Y6F3J3_9SPHN|nr:hypothetical protein SAMN06297468_1312 [Altererythrobacter xiamenensis]
MSFARTFVRLGSANVVMLAVHLVTIGLLGAISPSQQFGLFLLALSISLPFSAFAGLRFESAMPSVESARRLGVLLVLATSSIALVCLLQIAIILALSQLDLFEVRSLGPFEIAMLLGLTIAQTLVQIGRLWAIRQGNVARIMRATYVRAGAMSLARGCVAAILLLDRDMIASEVGFWLIAGELLVTIMMAGQLYPFAALRLHWGKAGSVIYRRTMIKYWKFPIIETPSTMLDHLAANAPILLVTQFYGLASTALFGLAYRGLAVPAAQLSKTLTEVMQTRYSVFQRARDWAALEGFFWRSTLLVTGASLAGLLVFAALIWALYDHLPESGKEFSLIVLLMSPWIAASTIVNINSRLLLMLQRQELKLIYDFLAVFAMAALWLSHSAFGWDLLTFVGWIALVKVGVYAIYWMLILIAVRSLRDRKAG